MTDSPLIQTARAIFAARMSNKDLNHTLQGGGVDYFAARCFDLAAVFEAEADKHRPQAGAPAELVKLDPELPPSVADVSCVVQGDEVFTLRLRRGGNASQVLEPHVLPYGGAKNHPDLILCSPVVDFPNPNPLNPNPITGWIVDMPTGEQRSFGEPWVRVIYSNGWLNVAKFRVGSGRFGEWQDLDADMVAGFVRSMPQTMRDNLAIITDFACMPQDTPLIGGNWLAVWPHRHKGRVCFSIFSDAPEPTEGPT